MNHQILDNPETSPKKNYAEISFRYFLYSFGGMIVFLLLCYVIISFGVTPSLPYNINGIVTFVAFVFGISGFFNGIKSIQNKEKNDYKKVIGIVGNSIWLLGGLLMIASIFGDVYRSFF